jgi:hypothetical protein
MTERLRHAAMLLLDQFKAYKESDLSHSDAHTCLVRYELWERLEEATFPKPKVVAVVQHGPRGTPGPWWIEDRRLTHPRTGSKAGGGGLLIQGSHAGPNSSRNVAQVNPYPHAGVEDDARMIAAAPELLAALQGMVEAYWRGSEDSEDGDAPTAVMDALAAIKKATTP